MMGEMEGDGSSKSSSNNGMPPQRHAEETAAGIATDHPTGPLQLKQHPPAQPPQHPPADDDDPDVSPREREHIGEIGRHYKPFSKRHGACLALFALSLAGCDDGRVGLWVKKACLALLVTSYADYLVRPSPLLDDTTVRLHAHDVRRPLWDKTVWSSLVYGFAGLYSLYLGQYALGTLQIVTCGGSTLYHLRKEAVYFNLDNTFASSLLFLTLYASGAAIHVEDWSHCLATALGLPVAVFLIVFCGMPATLARDPCTGHGVRQAAGAQYDDWHTAWHVASGLGTVVTAHFFQRHWPALQCGSPNFALMPDLPIVPTVCLLAGLLMNIAGNTGGIMPVH